MPIPTPFAELRTKAELHLKSLPAFAPLVERVGRCTLVPTRHLFASLVRAIIAQLISTAAAKTIGGRVKTQLGGHITPDRVLALEFETLRACGLSNAKAHAIRNAAEFFQKRPKLNSQLRDASDDEVREVLLSLKGIGPWTVEMLLIFSLGRLDVLPVGDMGLRMGAQDFFNLPDRPDAKTLTALAEPWRPYRSIATWYLWRSKDN